MIKYFSSLFGISVETVSECECDPVLTEIGAESEDGVPGIYQIVIQPQMCLQLCRVAE